MWYFYPIVLPEHNPARRSSYSVDSSKTPKPTNNSSANRSCVCALSNGDPQVVKSAKKKKSKNSKSTFKTWISFSRSSSNSGYTTTSLSGLPTLFSYKQEIWSGNNCEKNIKSRIYVCAVLVNITLLMAHKRNIQIPFYFFSNNVMKGISNDKVRIDHMFGQFTNSLYGLDNEMLQWFEEIYTYVVN
uniref:DDE_Tnp_1_7 domain-containing protein n=1 Tax=Strongyloides papillosus TaxID=174720 RepID=A0A0N5CBN1_STREA